MAWMTGSDGGVVRTKRVVSTADGRLPPRVPRPAFAAAAGTTVGGPAVTLRPPQAVLTTSSRALPIQSVHFIEFSRGNCGVTAVRRLTTERPVAATHHGGWSVVSEDLGLF